MKKKVIKLNRNELRELISEAIQTREPGSPLFTPPAVNEEFLRGIPEFVLRQATEKYVDEIRKQIFRFIMTNKSSSDVERRDALAAANQVLEELEEKANDLLEDQLYQFIRRV